MTYPFEKIHICIAVYDIDAKVRYFESIGIGPWRKYPPVAEYTEVDVPDYEGFRALRFVQANIGDVEIQLVEPSLDHDTPQKRFLEEHGEDVYHIGFVVDDVNEGEKILKKEGREDDESGAPSGQKRLQLPGYERRCRRGAFDPKICFRPFVWRKEAR